MMHDFQVENDPVRLRAEVRRLAENHDQVVGWLREKEDNFELAAAKRIIARRDREIERLRESLAQLKGGVRLIAEELEAAGDEDRAARLHEGCDFANGVLNEGAALGSITPPNPAP